MARWLGVLLLSVVSIALIGCGKKQLGPMDPNAVKTADPNEIKSRMDESAKHLPPGVKMPKGSMPEGK